MNQNPHPPQILEVNGLRKSFGKITAVQDVSFSVQAGQLFAFLGPNGAGKSTTINMLCTLTNPDAGTITLDGISATDQPAAVKKKIGVVFQDSLLDALLTVRENLSTRARFYYRSGSEMKAAIEKAAHAADVTKFLDRPYGKLSGGQRRRADIARALLNTPKILFMDEPTTGLDPQTRQHVWETIRRLQDEQKMTIFLTTHYMEEAATADYAVIVDEGKVVAKGTPQQLKQEYTTDTLRVESSTPDQLATLLSELPETKALNVTRKGARFTIDLPNTKAAIPILAGISTHIDRLEIQHGTMNDVFLNITGRELRS